MELCEVGLWSGVGVGGCNDDVPDIPILLCNRDNGLGTSIISVRWAGGGWVWVEVGRVFPVLKREKFETIPCEQNANAEPFALIILGCCPTNTLQILISLARVDAPTQSETCALYAFNFHFHKVGGGLPCLHAVIPGIKRALRISQTWIHIICVSVAGITGYLPLLSFRNSMAE